MRRQVSWEELFTVRGTKGHGGLAALPLALSAALVLTACGGGGDNDTAAQSTSADTPSAATSAVKDSAPAQGSPVRTAGAANEQAPTKNATTTAAKRATTTEKKAASAKVVAATDASKGEKTSKQESASVADAPNNGAPNNGATDIGVTRDSIRMGTVSAHGIALGNMLVTPMVNGIKGAFASINERGGVLGRRLSLVDCDDGPGEVSRSKACLKRLAVQDKVFGLLSYSSWASASVHDDLKQYKLPAVGTWAYSQTEWQDPYMFPTHMSMIHEAMAGANWVKNVIKPKTYALVCLTSPEMQLACGEVRKILDASGSKLVKKVDVAISETSLSSYILSLRAANPEHVIHYVINPATMAKFMVEAAQQNYYPAKGISGNHLAAEVLGSLFGKHAVGRYWTNTTYKLWGPEFMATMAKYARGNRGLNHHIVQANYVGSLIFERAAKAVGPNLTRERLMAQLGNGDVYAADASLDQKFAYGKAERSGTYEDQTWSKDMGQGREYMYKYTATNTFSAPDGSPSGFEPDPDQFVIHTDR